MTLLLFYVALALGVSFLCSVAEAVLLSITPAHLELSAQQGRKSGALLKQMKADINSPLAAILTLNTIAHTVGAAGAGAQAAVVFGNDALGVASAVLTLLILVFSEIIPKTLGAVYWRQLAPATAWFLRGLMWMLWPFVKLSALLTSSLSHGPTLSGFSREEFQVMAELGEREGQLEPQERKILENLFRLRDLNVSFAMTPRTVMYTADPQQSVDDFLEGQADSRFSRIPLRAGGSDRLSGFVLRMELLLASAQGKGGAALQDFKRELLVLPGSLSMLRAYEQMLGRRAQIAAIVDEYGATLGLLTLEDVLETLLGMEIVDESDRASDMQALARELWRKRATGMGISVDQSNPE